jgi:cellulose biosynthesis protein BcsQ
MYRNTSAHNAGLALLKDAYGDAVYPPTTLRTVWSEASYSRQTVYAYAPESPASEEAWALVGRVMLGVEHV